MSFMPHKIEIGSETGIEADERYCLSASTLEEEWQQELARKIMKKSETNFLKRMVEKVLNIMGGGIFMVMNI